MRLGKIKNSAQNFLRQYENQNPASYAAAQQAIGGLLILDGFVGIDNPFGGKKRPGIFGSLVGVVVGVVFLFVPTIFNHISGINNLTATTNATVVSISQDANTNNSNNSSGNSCSAVAKYTVNGTHYQQTSSFGSSSLCGFTPGSSIAINYNPNKPGDWGYNVKTITTIMKIFPLVGVLVIITGIVTFALRLASIIFGWKLLRSGRALAKTLPEGTDLSTVINEMKQEFSQVLFGKGVAEPMAAPQPAAVPAQPAPVTPSAAVAPSPPMPPVTAAPEPAVAPVAPAPVQPPQASEAPVYPQPTEPPAPGATIAPNNNPPSNDPTTPQQ